MLAALLLGQAFCCQPLPPPPPEPPQCRCECQCAPAAPHEEVRLGGDFFINEGGVGPAFAPPVYGGGGGVVIVEGGGFSASGGRATVSATASANVSVRIVGGYRPMPGKPQGGHTGGYGPKGGHGGGKH